MADPLTELWNALTGNFLCMLGAFAFGILLFLLIIILYIRRIHKESEWAYNPDKSFKLRWRRG